MEKIKILHTADLHFDTAFRDLPPKIAEIKKEELKETFLNIINLAKKEMVDVIFICGDLFDNLRISKNTIEFINNAFKSIEHIKVFISAGNHDPKNEKGFYELFNWNSNVKIFRNEIEKVYLEKYNTNIYGFSFKENYIRESVLKGFKCHEDKINIMVMHGEISKNNQGNEYNPITLSDIRDSNLDYLALGHRHAYSGINKEGITCYAYSGCPEGRGFDEVGDKGVIIGEIYKGHVDLKFTPICKRKYEVLDIDISSVESYVEIRERVISEIPKAYRENNYYKVRLVGEIKEDFIINKELLLDYLRNDFYFLKLEDKTTLKINLEDISKEYSLKGLYTKEILSLLENNEEDEEILKMALKFGLKSLSGEEVQLSEY